MMESSESLYANPDVYASAFGERDDEEISFYTQLLKTDSRVLSLGCGDGCLEKILVENLNLKITGIDASGEMIASARRLLPEHDFHKLKFEDLDKAQFSGTFDAVISPLLSMNYLSSQVAWKSLLAAIHPLLRADGMMILDILISESPKRFQGIIERGDHHELRFYDVLEKDGFLTMIMTELLVHTAGKSFSRHSPLALIKPDDFELFANANGFEVLAWYAPHDLGTESKKPPDDARRAVVCLKKLSSH